MTRISPTAGRLLLWAVNSMLVLVFLVVGAAKFVLPEMWEDHFVHQWGLPPGLVSWVGWLEVAGAVLLLPRRTAPLGGTLLAIIMAGATATHVLHGQFMQAPVSLALLVLAAWVAARRQQMAAIEIHVGDDDEADAAGAP
jgi:putative oxidoreductase